MLTRGTFTFRKS